MSSRTACGTCHLRMVFCDSTRPYCQTCIDGGFVCSGYSASISSQHSSQDTPERGPVRPSHTLSVRGRRQSTTVFSRASSRPTSPQQIRRPRSLSLPTHTNGAANQNRILSVFLDLASPGGNINNVPAQYAWLQILPTRRLRGEALPLAISALCGVHLGTIRRDQRLLQGARVHYTEALQKLATTLTQIDGGDYDETFASIMILTLCELFQAIAEDGTGWRSHVRGAASFLQRHGPSAVNNKLSRLLLHNARLSAVYLGELHREKIFLDHPSWTPFKSVSASSASSPSIASTSTNTNTNPNNNDNDNDGDDDDPDGFTAFIDLCILVPTLMSLCKAAAQENSVHQITEMLRRGDALQTQFANWFDTHLRHSGLEWVTTSSSPLFSAFHPSSASGQQQQQQQQEQQQQQQQSQQVTAGGFPGGEGGGGGVGEEERGRPASTSTSTSTSTSAPRSAPTAATAPTGQETFPIIFSFPSIRSASLHLEYWSARLNIARAVSDMIRESGLAPGNATLLRFAQSTESEVLLCATKVCQCVPFCCQPAPSPLARVSSLLCLVVAFEAFERCGRVEQSLWCRRAVGVLREAGLTYPGPFPPRQRPLLSPEDSFSREEEETRMY